MVRVLEHKAQSTKSLEEAKAEIIATLKQQKAETVVLAQADKFVQELASGKTVDGVKFGAEQTWVFAENKNPALNN